MNTVYRTYNFDRKNLQFHKHHQGHTLKCENDEDISTFHFQDFVQGKDEEHGLLKLRGEFLGEETY